MLESSSVSDILGWTNSMDAQFTTIVRMDTGEDFRVP